MIKKRLSQVNTSSTRHREFQRRKDKTENKEPRIENKIKYKSSMNNSARGGENMDHVK
jgi:hypothetical protein